MQRAHYRKLVNVIAESSPGECVVLYSAQLLELRGPGSVLDASSGPGEG